VAEEHRPESVDLDRRGLGKAGQELQPLGAEPARLPFALAGGDAVGVPADEPDALAQTAQPVDGLGRHRPTREVAAHEEEVGIAGLGEHGLERRQVGVDVVERGDAPHRVSASRGCARS